VCAIAISGWFKVFRERLLMSVTSTEPSSSTCFAIHVGYMGYPIRPRGSATGAWCRFAASDAGGLVVDGRELVHFLPGLPHVRYRAYFSWSSRQCSSRPVSLRITAVPYRATPRPVASIAKRRSGSSQPLSQGCPRPWRMEQLPVAHGLSLVRSQVAMTCNWNSRRSWLWQSNDVVIFNQHKLAKASSGSGPAVWRMRG
jgi:hypothetical protein